MPQAYTMTRISRQTRSRWLIGFSTLAIAAALASNAKANSKASVGQNAGSVETRWAEFQANPSSFMNRIPSKKTSGPRKPIPSFEIADIKSGKFVDFKNGMRSGGVGFEFAPGFRNANGVAYSDILDGRAGALERAIDFFDPNDFKRKKPVLRLDEMEKDSLLAAELKETPWSDTYWPIYKGSLGARYANSKFSAQSDWKGYSAFVLKKNEKLSAIASKANPLMLESLSPSEKYDLLIGDVTGGQTEYEAGYLTPHMWEEGRRYWDSEGKVEAWMGLCHGWAAASYMAKRPTKAIEVTTANPGVALTFYPSDIKGLTTYLWAKTNVATNFIGGRCNSKDAEKDPDTGRVLDEKCFDTNPANWHQIIVNQIGVAKRSFVLDATFDYEVWNQPVTSYSYKYFNPQTGRGARSLRTATVPVDKFTKDKFKKFRSPEAVSVVGIEMDVTYVVETDPNHNEIDSAENDATTTVTYMYDLELDANGNIIGGEWYSNIHPDFLWNPTKDSKATTVGDSRLTGGWDGKSELPQFWKDIAVKTAVHGGLPLAAIIDGLSAASNKE